MKIHWNNVAWFCFGVGMASMKYDDKFGSFSLLAGLVAIIFNRWAKEYEERFKDVEHD